MKRKFFSALAVGMAVLGLCACESTNKETVKETGKETQTIVVETENKETETQETEAEESKAQEGAAIESEIRRLVDENLYCMRDVFVLSMIWAIDTAIDTVIGEIKRCKQYNTIAVIVFLDFSGKSINLFQLFLVVTCQKNRSLSMGKSLLQFRLGDNLINKLQIILVGICIR